MATNDDPTQNSIAIPARSTVLGVDGDGSTHYLGNRVTAEGIPVYVEHADGEREVYDLTETPCFDAPAYDDPVEAWIDHVEATRGAWDRIEYGRSLVDVLAAEVPADD
jgi:hypothetical protein